LRRNWYRHASASGNSSAKNPGQRVSIPLYSGKEAETRVIDQDIICKLCNVTRQFIEEYSDLDELHNCGINALEQEESDNDKL